MNNILKSTLLEKDANMFPSSTGWKKFDQVVNIPSINDIFCWFLYFFIWYELNTCHVTNYPLNG